MSLYAKYQEEMYNREVIETDYGFITYSVFEDNTIYGHSLYILPEMRNKGKAKELESILILKHRPKEIFLYVDLTTENPKQSLNAFIKGGYMIHEINHNSIIMCKQLRK